MIDIDRVAAAIVPWLREHGTGLENNLVIGEDPYKPVYRAMSLLFYPAFTNWDQTEIAKGLNKRIPTIGEARAIFRRAHPFFEHCVDTEPDAFIQMYDFHREAFE
jgi:hypothetical protein